MARQPAGFAAGSPQALAEAGSYRLPVCLSVCLPGHALLLEDARNKHRYVKIPRKVVILGP